MIIHWTFIDYLSSSYDVLNLLNIQSSSSPSSSTGSFIANAVSFIAHGVYARPHNKIDDDINYIIQTVYYHLIYHQNVMQIFYIYR